MLIVDAQVHLGCRGCRPTRRTARSRPGPPRIAPGHGCGRGQRRADPPAGLGPQLRGDRRGGRGQIPEPLRDSRQFSARQAGKPQLVAGWKSRPGMLGLRYAFTQPHQANWMTDGTMDWLWPACEKAGIPIALMASNYLPQVGQIAERHPGLKLIHRPLRPGRATARTMPRTAIPAQRAGARQIPQRRASNATGAPGNSSQPYPFRNIHKYLSQICTKRSGRSAASGAPTSPACRARGNNA